MIGIIHPAIAIALQLAIGLATGNFWYGVCTAMLYVGREHAQAEYRWIERYGFHRRANLPWWGAFDRRVWDLHSITDVVLPVIATAGIALIHSLYR